MTHDFREQLEPTVPATPEAAASPEEPSFAASGFPVSGFPVSGFPDSGSPVSGETGNPTVDRVLGSLGALADTPVDEHVAVFEAAHDQLRSALAGAGDAAVDPQR